MNGLWSPTTSRSQKWLVSLFLLFMLGALPPMFWRSFVPSDAWQLRALYLSVCLTGAGLLWLRRSYKSGQWKPAGPWLDYGPVKRMLMAPLCVAFVILIVWLNLAVSWPMAYTHWMGSESSLESMAEKKQGSGRRSCSHQLKLQDMDYLFFEFCVAEDGFERLPEQPMPALLSVRQSYFGMRVESVRLAVPRE